ncbi:unnamed protein product [Notodromas monacha]|uniref:Uncharacterized protein n=1 Tax=Notodromas monacha TaxID=399045 RepID=A0A7R9GH77_9CRUS|nr:unnamed protein product [Notodromas monacha]CAG0922595.1 unnamed protein product [Notodromas monacha]
MGLENRKTVLQGRKTANGTKSGCAAFGHSCFGAHGKRALGVANPEDVLPENEAHLIMEDDLSREQESKLDGPEWSKLLQSSPLLRALVVANAQRLSDRVLLQDEADHQQDEQMLEDDLRFRNVRLRPHQGFQGRRKLVNRRQLLIPNQDTSIEMDQSFMENED